MIKFQDLFAGEWSPAFPNRPVIRVGKSVLSIELKLVYFKIGKVID